MKKTILFCCILLGFTTLFNAQHLTTMEELEILQNSRSVNLPQNNVLIDIEELLNRQIPEGNQISNFNAIFTSEESQLLRSYNRSLNRIPMINWIPTAGATETFTPDVGDLFFDPGGPGGGPDGSPGNYPNCGCLTQTTLAGVTQIEFLDYEVFGNFDWLRVYDGANNTGTVLFDNSSTGANNGANTFAQFLAANGGSGVFNATSGNFFFEFFATAVVNRLGWEVEILATGSGGGGGACDLSIPVEAQMGISSGPAGYFVEAGTQLGRLFRDGVATVCPSKPYPGNFNPATTYNWTSVRFYNSDAGNVCITVNVDVDSGASPCTTNGHAMVYQSPGGTSTSSYNPLDIGENFIGDVGSSLSQPFSVEVGPGWFEVVFSNTTTQNNCDFSFTISDGGTGAILCDEGTGGGGCITGTFATRPAFEAAFSGFLNLENFAGPSGIIACNGPINSSGNSCYGPGAILPGISVTTNTPAEPDPMVFVQAGSFGNTVDVVGANQFASFTIIEFPNGDVDAFGFDLISLLGGGNVDIRIFGTTSGLLDTFTVNATSQVFFGYIASEILDRVEIQDLTGANAELIGMLVFGLCDGSGGGPGTCDNETFVAAGLPADIDPGATQTANCIAAPNLYPVNVTGNGIIGDDATLEDVTINITHTWSGDLEIYLISPSGTELMLWDNVGGSGDNFTNTQFQDGGIPTTGSTAPHTNIYQPIGGTFAATFDGEEINGNWQLKICDTAAGDTGTLDSFTITFCIEDAGGPINNWECADAIALSCGDVATGTTVGATNSGGNASPDVFYSYTGSGTPEFVTISLCDGGTTYDSFLRVYESCANLSTGAAIASNDDFCGLQSQLTFESDGTTTYIIMVEGFGTASGAYSLAITCEPNLPPACGGEFTDSGGASGNYSNNEDITWTISPDDPDDFVTVIFTAFDVESNWDALYVFDGPDTSSPLISSGNPPTNGGFPAGGYWGTTIPGPFASTHPSGALTFRFLSDGSVTRPGWIADVVCSPVPPPNDLIENAISVTNEAQPYTDPAVRLQYATNELLNPEGCAIAGTNGVWYSFTAGIDGTAQASITTPAGTSAVIFYEAPSEDVGDETDLTYNFEVTNQCAPGTASSITTTAGQSYYIFVLNTGGPSDIVIDISGSLGTNDNSIDGFVMYPNPASNVLNLNSNVSIDDVTVYNMLGQRVYAQTIGATRTQIDVSGLSTGTYLIKVNAGGQTATYQFLKK